MGLYGISINRENAEKQLQELTTLEYGLMRGLQEGPGQEIEQDHYEYIVKPMSGDTKTKLQAMMNDIGSVSLPNWPVYSIIEKQLERYAKGELSAEQAYTEATNNLKQYLEQ